MLLFKTGSLSVSRRILVSTSAQLVELLREARLRRGWTKTQVAEALGVDDSAVGGWEKGRHRPGVVILLAWARLVGVGLWAIPEDQESGS